jgi:hypothetical protein
MRTPSRPRGRAAVALAALFSFAAAGCDGDPAPPPALALPVITRPAAGDDVEGVVPVLVDVAWDEAPAAVALFADGEEVGRDDAPPWQIDWDTRSGRNGTLTIYARAIARDGGERTSEPRTLAVSNPDLVAPTVRLLGVAAGDTARGPVTLRAEATDNVRVHYVSFFAGGWLIERDQQAPWEVLWNTKRTANGRHRLSAEGIDAAFNEGRSDSVEVIVSNPTRAAILNGSEPGSAHTFTVQFNGAGAVHTLAPGDTAVYNATPYETQLRVRYRYFATGQGQQDRTETYALTGMDWTRRFILVGL